MPVSTFHWNEMPPGIQKRIRWLEKKSYPRHLRGLMGVEDDTICLVWADDTNVVWGYLLINPYDDPDEPAGCDAWIVDFCVGKEARRSARAALGLVAAVRRLTIERQWARVRMQLRPQTTGRLLESLNHQILGEGLGGTIDVAVNLLRAPRDMGRRHATDTIADEADSTVDTADRELAGAAYPSDDSFAGEMQAFVEGVLAGEARIVEWDEPDAALTVRLVVARDGEQLTAHAGAWPMPTEAQAEVSDDNRLRPAPVRLWEAGSFARPVALPIGPAFFSRRFELPTVPVLRATQNWTKTLGDWFAIVQDAIYAPSGVLSEGVEAAGTQQRQVAGTRSRARRYDAEDWQREAEIDLLERAQDAQQTMPLSRRAMAGLVKAAVAVLNTDNLPDFTLENIYADRQRNPARLTKSVEQLSNQVSQYLIPYVGSRSKAYKELIHFIVTHQERGLLVALLLERHGYVEMSFPTSTSEFSSARMGPNTIKWQFPANLLADFRAVGIPGPRPSGRGRGSRGLQEASSETPEERTAREHKTSLYWTARHIDETTRALLALLVHLDMHEQARKWRVPTMLVYAIVEAGLSDEERRQITNTVRRFDIGRSRRIPIDSQGHRGISGRQIIDVYRRFGARGLQEWLSVLPRRISETAPYPTILPSPQRRTVRHLRADVKLQQFGIERPQSWLLGAFPKMGPFGRLCVYWSALHHQGQCSPDQFADAVNQLQWLGEDGARRLRDGGLGYRKVVQLIRSQSRDEVMAWAALDAVPGRLLAWRNQLFTDWGGFVASNKRQVQRLVAADPLPLPLPSQAVLHQWASLQFPNSNHWYAIRVGGWSHVLNVLTGGGGLNEQAGDSMRAFLLNLWVPGTVVDPTELSMAKEDLGYGVEISSIKKAVDQIIAGLSLSHDLPDPSRALREIHRSLMKPKTIPEKMGQVLNLFESNPQKQAELVAQWWRQFVEEPGVRESLETGLQAHVDFALDWSSYADARRGLRVADADIETGAKLAAMAPAVRGLYVQAKLVRRAIDQLWDRLLEQAMQHPVDPNKVAAKMPELSLYVGALYVALVKAGRHSGVTDLFVYWGIHDHTEGALPLDTDRLHDRGLIVRSALPKLTHESAVYLTDRAKARYLDFASQVAILWQHLLAMGRDPHSLDHRSRADLALVEMLLTTKAVVGYESPDVERVPGSIVICMETETMQVMPKQHPWTLASGLETGSCIRPGGVGFAAGEHAFTSPDGAFLGIVVGANTPAGSWLWRDGPQLMVDSLDGEWSQERSAMLLAWALGTVGRLGITRILLNKATHGQSYEGIIPVINFSDWGLTVTYPRDSYTDDFSGKGFMLAADPSDPFFESWVALLNREWLSASAAGQPIWEALDNHLREYLTEDQAPAAFAFLRHSQQHARFARPEAGNPQAGTSLGLD